MRVELRLRPGAAVAQVIEQGGSAGKPGRFKESEAADDFGGIELAAHQVLKSLVWKREGGEEVRRRLDPQWLASPRQ